MSPRFPDPARFAGSRLLRVQSDERLVALTRDGYEAAFSAIVDRYRAPLERYAARIIGDSRAEDAVQQAFANAHRALIRDDRPISLKAWLYRITHNAALNQLRSVHDDVALDDETLGRPATAMAAAHDTSVVVELQSRLRETLDLIAALPPNQRDALLLAELEGRSHDEIALALDIPSETVRHRVMQARTTLRAAVSALVPYPIAASLANAAASGSESARTAAEIAAGAGAGAVAMKITAGLTATGALVTAFALPSIDTRSIDAAGDPPGAPAVLRPADDARTQMASAFPGGSSPAPAQPSDDVAINRPLPAPGHGVLTGPAETGSVGDLGPGLGGLVPVAGIGLGLAVTDTPLAPGVEVPDVRSQRERDPDRGRDGDRSRSAGDRVRRERGSRTPHIGVTDDARGADRPATDPAANVGRPAPATPQPAQDPARAPDAGGGAARPDGGGGSKGPDPGHGESPADGPDGPPAGKPTGQRPRPTPTARPRPDAPPPGQAVVEDARDSPGSAGDENRRGSDNGRGDE